MRHLPLALALLATAAHAQTPDPTPAARYFPLGVGDEWQYEVRAFMDAPPQTVRRVVVRDSVVGGVRYAVRDDSRSAGPGAPLVPHARELLRVDAATARVVLRLADGTERAQTCPLNSAFGVRLDCTPWSGTDGGPDETQVSGSVGGTVDLGGTLVAVEAQKGFVVGFGDGGTDRYAAPLGYLGNTGAFCEGCSFRLRFARVAGVEYGTRVVAAAEMPDAARVAVAVSPNPASGTASVHVVLPDAVAALRVAVFDALGRRVRTLYDGPLGAGETPFTLDAAALPAGVYVVRVGSSAAARFTVAR